jgi:hypothetical protein
MTGAYSHVWQTLSNPATPSSSDPARAAIASLSVGGCDQPMSIWTDSSSQLYGVTTNFCNGGNSVVFKMNRTTGTMVGWKGGISYTTAPSGGDTGCQGLTGAVTPGWCQYGATNPALTLGNFMNGTNGIAGDSYFVYVSDEVTHRVTRVPK